MLVDPPSPPLPTYGKSIDIFYCLKMRLFIFTPLKYQKYLEKFYNSAKRVVVEGGGRVIREKNKSV